MDNSKHIATPQLWWTTSGAIAFIANGSLSQVNQGVKMIGCWALVRRKFFVDSLSTEQDVASRILTLCRGAGKQLPVDDAMENQRPVGYYRVLINLVS